MNLNNTTNNTINITIKPPCHLCKRNCNIDRNIGNKGYCGVNSTLKLARAALHMWEEPCITGVNGSGTVFFSGCPLRCVFCQNYSIAHASAGKEISVERLAEIFLELQEKGAHNINLVSPTQYVPQIIKAIDLSKLQGLNLPIVYNTGSYEQVETIKMLNGYVDIYLPDLKYYDSELSKRYSNAADYFTVATAAINEMFKQVGKPVFENDLMKLNQRSELSQVAKQWRYDMEVSTKMSCSSLFFNTPQLVQPG